MKLSEDKVNQIIELCKVHKVKSLFAFGSVLTDNFNEDSDIDLVVDFNETDPFTYTDLYFNLKYKLEDLLKKPIDLLEDRAIRNPFFKNELNATKVKIYG